MNAKCDGMLPPHPLAESGFDCGELSAYCMNPNRALEKGIDPCFGQLGRGPAKSDCGENSHHSLTSTVDIIPAIGLPGTSRPNVVKNECATDSPQPNELSASKAKWYD